MSGLPNFPLLFKQIGNYLAKAPNASQEELDAARTAYNTITGTVYYMSPSVKCPDSPIIQHVGQPNALKH